MPYFEDFRKNFESDTITNPTKLRDAIVGILAQYVADRSRICIFATNDYHLKLVCGFNNQELSRDRDLTSIVSKSTNGSLIKRLINFDTNKENSFQELQKIIKDAYFSNWCSNKTIENSKFTRGKLSEFLSKLNNDPTSPLKTHNLVKLLAQYNINKYQTFNLNIEAIDYSKIGGNAIEKYKQQCAIIQTSVRHH